MPSHTFEFDFEYKGVFYSVVAEAEIGVEDNSFDHEFGTERVLDCGLDDCSFSVSKTNADGTIEEVNENEVEGLYNALWEEIEDKVTGLNPSDFDWRDYYDWEEDDF
jgi:hypothetical protein